MPDLREWYLVEVESRLRGRIPVSDLNTIMRELESHLFEAHDQAKSQGMSEEDAQHAVLELMGSPVTLVRQEIRRRSQPMKAATKIGPWLAAITGFSLLNATLSPYLLKDAVTAFILLGGLCSLLWAGTASMAGRFWIRPLATGLFAAVMVQFVIGSQIYRVHNVRATFDQGQINPKSVSPWGIYEVPRGQATQVLMKLNSVYAEASKTEQEARKQHKFNKVEYLEAARMIDPYVPPGSNLQGLEVDELFNLMKNSHEGSLIASYEHAYTQLARHYHTRAKAFKDSQINLTSAEFHRKLLSTALSDFQTEVSKPAWLRGLRAIQPPFSMALLSLILLPWTTFLIGRGWKPAPKFQGLVRR